MGTAAQRRAWTSFGNAACGWETLTEDQYRAWDEAAKQENRRRHLRRGYRLNGQNLFTESEEFGAPWPGSRVIIATQQQVDGWRDLLRRLDAIVPGGQGPAVPLKRRRTTARA